MPSYVTTYDAFGRASVTLPTPKTSIPQWWQSAREKAIRLLPQLSLQQKLGQLNQVNTSSKEDLPHLLDAIKRGDVGSVINEVEPDILAELQRVAREQSPLGIPLLMGRDVIHGFNTIFPLPLALACSWNTELATMMARCSAVEASAVGINWTFSPMIDVSRDPRWGRIAESFGEDPLLNSVMGAAMIQGYQTDSPSSPSAIAACAKHFAGYGASESGKDYNTANISQHELYNVHFPAFKSAVEAQALSFMTSFSDLNGMPVSGNQWLLTDVLRNDWGFKGMVVSDWNSIAQLVAHGVAEHDKEAAYLALQAGVDMDMVSQSYLTHAADLVANNIVNEASIDEAVLRVLTMKYALGLFDETGNDPTKRTEVEPDAGFWAQQAATMSCVLLKNNNQTLPLTSAVMQHIAVFGFLADDPYEQLGTWVFDADLTRSVTIMDALRAWAKENQQSPAHIDYFPMMASTRSHELMDTERACATARQADTVIVCVGEEAILSGEAHCRADIHLPGAQVAMIELLAAQARSVIVVVMAGRPLVISEWIDKVDAVLYAWHPGSFAGPAILDLLRGKATPQGKLAATLPRHAGQIPIYYATKPSGRPVTSDNYVPMEAFPMRAAQTSLGMATSHIDTHYSPLFPFGFGLSYTKFHYENAKASASTHHLTGEWQLELSVTLTNTGQYEGTEVVQVYLNDKVCRQTRPEKSLVAFERVHLCAGESNVVKITLPLRAFAFITDTGESCVEEGEFTLFIGTDSANNMPLTFTLSARDILQGATPK